MWPNVYGFIAPHKDTEKKKKKKHVIGGEWKTSV